MQALRSPDAPEALVRDLNDRLTVRVEAALPFPGACVLPFPLTPHAATGPDE